MQNSPLIKETPLFLEDKPAVYALRQKSKKALETTGFPTTKTEAWKYTDTKTLVNTPFNVDTSEDVCDGACCHHHKEESGFIDITFCRGKLHIEEFNTPEGLTIIPLPLVLFEGIYKPFLLSSFNLEQHPFAALNGLYLEQGLCIHVEKNTKITTPIRIRYNQSSAQQQHLPLHNIFILENNAELEVIEQFSSKNENSYFTNIVNEIYLRENAKLNHYKIQKESSQAYHIALTAAKIQKSAKYKQYYMANGAKLCRQETLINLMQTQAQAEIYSAYLAKKNCLNDITTNINHFYPETTSNQYVKAVLEDDSSAVFQGKIHIAPKAVKTSGHQLHKALYLNNNAELNCKPELEIFADDVKCSHGASCGEIDKEQLFYLTSRGISKEDAVKMLTAAHLEEVIALIPNEKIKELFQF